MQLIEFGYKEMGWTLHSVKGIPLTNLIVGKNSAGKSKTTIEQARASCEKRCRQISLFGENHWMV